MRYFIALLLALTLGFAQSSSAQCITFTKLLVPGPPCDQAPCGLEFCNTCAEFEITIPNGCSLESIRIDPDTEGQCFYACSNELPVIEEKAGCAPGQMKLRAPGGGSLIGPTTARFRICATGAASFTIIHGGCTPGCPGSFSATVP